MSGGGKGGKQTTEVKIPKWLEGPVRENIAKANEIAKIGYTPYYGPDVAAFTPMQEAAFANTAAGASAFGLGTPVGSAVTGMPAPQTFAGGIQGYSSGSLYDQALAELQRRNPGQFAAISSLFINPQTGAAPTANFALPEPPARSSSGLHRIGGGGGGGGGYYGGGGGGDGDRWVSSNIASRLPGGVNTRDPSSTINQAIGSRTSTNSTPTASDRPRANPRR